MPASTSPAKLVTIGDSLTQGFQHLAINHSDRGYPSMLAEALGERDFDVPTFRGYGGYPLNLEWIARGLEARYGHDLRRFEWIRALSEVFEMMDDVEDYWERGKGAERSLDCDYHNLGIWGFEVSDAYEITAQIASDLIAQAGNRDNRFSIPNEARMRTALDVLNPARDKERMQDTQITIARRIAEKRGIEHLIVWLGGNNALGTVVGLEIIESSDDRVTQRQGSPGSRVTVGSVRPTLWTLEHFKHDYDKLASYIDTIDAQNIYLGTVPHVTIPPVTRGVMEDARVLPRGQRYFDYYTRFSVQDRDFVDDPDSYPYLTGQQARDIDARIDGYNNHIRTVARNRGWHVIEFGQELERLAPRRNWGNPPGASELPRAFAGLSTRFFEIGANGRLINGGLMGLDGIHPTTCGYAVVAKIAYEAIRAANPNMMLQSADSAFDFDFIRRMDTLVSDPPRTLDDIFGMLNSLERFFGLDFLFRAMFR